MRRSIDRGWRQRRKRRRRARQRRRKPQVIQAKPIYQTKRRAQKRHPCPTCGKKGWRKRIESRLVRHLAHKVSAFVRIIVGVYAAPCACAKFFASTVEGVALRAGYTDAARQKVVDLIVLDHLPLRNAQSHLEEDFALEVAVGFIYDCLNGAEAKIDKTASWQGVLKSFSGVMGVDEVHDGGRTILVATDPLNDFTVDFSVHEKNAPPFRNAFLDGLKNRGLRVLVAITDGSPLYKRALGERGKGLQHQLCVFHVLKDQMDEVLAAIRQDVDRLLRVFAKGLTPQAARNRRTRVLGDRRSTSQAFLAQPLQMLANDAVFEKRIVSLGGHHVDRTRNPVERKNRRFRKTQKTCYTRRATRGIEQAYGLRIDRESQLHPLHTEPGVARFASASVPRVAAARGRLAGARAPRGVIVTSRVSGGPPDGNVQRTVSGRCFFIPAGAMLEPMPFPVTAGILAGGAGSRLGRDKALYPYRGRPLLTRQLEILRPMFERVVVAARDPSRYAGFGVDAVADLLPVRSALSGIHAVLSAARTEHAFVVACDLPFLSPRLIEALVSAREGWDAVVPESEAGPEPLHAVYARSCLPAIEASAARGEWKATAFLAAVRARSWPARGPEWLAGGRSPFFNVNTPADAAELDASSREF